MKLTEQDSIWLQDAIKAFVKITSNTRATEVYDNFFNFFQEILENQEFHEKWKGLIIENLLEVEGMTIGDFRKIMEMKKKLKKWREECNPDNSIGYGIRIKIDEILEGKDDTP